MSKRNTQHAMNRAMTKRFLDTAKARSERDQRRRDMGFAIDSSACIVMIGGVIYALNGDYSFTPLATAPDTREPSPPLPS